MKAARVLPALVPIVVLVGGAIWTLQLAFDLGRSYEPGSSYRSDASGTRALYLLLEEMGQKPRRTTRPVPAVPGAVLVCVEPSGYPLDRDQELLEWVRAGGTLIFAPAAPTTERESRTRRPRVTDHQSLTDRLGLQAVTGAAPAAPAQGSPLREALPGFAKDEAPWMWKTVPKGARVLLGSEAGAVLLELPFGAGRVYALSAPAWLENGGIGEGDRLRLARFLLEPSRPVFFDEFRHGLAERPGLGYVLSRYGLLPTACAGLLFLGLVAWRTTPREAEPPEEAEGAEVRDSLVDVRAGLYARTLTPREALHLLERDLRRGVSVRVGQAAAVSWKDAQKRLAQRRPALAARLRSLLADLQRTKSRPPSALEDVLPLSGEVAAFLREVQ